MAERVCFVYRIGRRFSVWILVLLLTAVAGMRSAEAQKLRQLTNTPLVSNFPAAISGDGRRVFYLRSEFTRIDEPNSLTLLMREGDARVPVVLAEDLRLDWILADQTGSRLVMGYHAFSFLEDASSRVFSFDVATRTLKDLLPGSFSTERSDCRIAYDPDRERVFVSSGQGQRTGLMVISLATGEITTLLTSTGVENLVVEPSDGWLYYRVGAEVRRLRPEDPQPQLVYRLNHSASISDVFVAPGGGLLTIRASDQSIFQYDVASAVTRRIFVGGFTRLVDVSADGTRILVESSLNLAGENADRSRELFLCRIDGRFCSQLTEIESPGRVRGELLLDPNRPRGFLDRSGDMVLLAAVTELPNPERAAFDRRLYRVNAATKEFLIVDSAGSPGGFFLPGSFGDGSHAVFRSNDGLTDGSRFVAARLDGSHFAALTPEVGDVFSAAYSGDASTIAFPIEVLEGGEGIQKLMVHRRGAGLSQVAELNLGEPCGVPNVFGCPPPPPRIIGLDLDLKGETLIVSSEARLRPIDPEQRGYLYLVRLRGSNPDLMLVAEGEGGLVSGDGRTLAWNADSHVFTGMVDGAGPGDVFDLGEGDLQAISRNGRRLALIDPSGGAILTDVDDGTRTPLTDPDLEDFRFQSLQISAEGDRVAALVGSLDGTRQEFRVYDETGIRLLRFEFPPWSEILTWSLSPGAERIYFNSASSLLNHRAGTVEVFVLELGPTTTVLAGLPDPSRSLVGVAVTNQDSESVTLQLEWLDDDPTAPPVDPLSLQLEPGEQRIALLPDLFPSATSGTLRLRGSGSVGGYAVSGSFARGDREGTVASSALSDKWLLPLSTSLPTDGGEKDLEASLALFNPGPQPADVRVLLSHSLLPNSRRYQIPPQAAIRIDVIGDLTRAGSTLAIDRGLLEVTSTVPIQARLELSCEGAIAGLSGMEASQTGERVFFPFGARGPGFDSWLWIFNGGDSSAEFRAEARGSDGDPAGEPLTGRVPARSMVPIPVAELTSGASFAGSILVSGADGEQLGGALVSLGPGGSLVAYSALQPLTRELVTPFLVETEELFSSLAMANPYDFPVDYRIDVFDASGEKRASESGWIAAHGWKAKLLRQILPSFQVGGRFRVSTDRPIFLLALQGAISGGALAYLGP